MLIIKQRYQANRDNVFWYRKGVVAKCGKNVLKVMETPNWEIQLKGESFYRQVDGGRRKALRNGWTDKDLKQHKVAVIQGDKYFALNGKAIVLWAYSQAINLLKKEYGNRTT